MFTLLSLMCSKWGRQGCLELLQPLSALPSVSKIHTFFPSFMYECCLSLNNTIVPILINIRSLTNSHLTFLCWPLTSLHPSSSCSSFHPSGIMSTFHTSVRFSLYVISFMFLSYHISPEPWAGHAHHLPPSCLLLFIDVKQMPSFSCLLSMACSL